MWMAVAMSGLLFTACDDDDDIMTDTEPTGTLEVNDRQFLAENQNQVRVNNVNLSDDGWVVVRRDNNGQPGEVIGSSMAAAGEQSDVNVTLNNNANTRFGDTYWVGLYNDAGTIGTFEEGVDMPVMSSNNQTVQRSFSYDFPANAETDEIELTGRDMEGASGNATFYRGADNATYVVLNTEGTPAGSVQPASINMGTAATPAAAGPNGTNTAFTLEDVRDNQSITRITSFDQGVNDGAAVSYVGLQDFDGYINVANSADDMNTTALQGDVGRNAFTGNQTTYNLNTENGSGASGTVTLQERRSGNALATTNITGGMQNSAYSATFNEGDAGSGGAVTRTLNGINTDATGAGMSQTDVDMLDDQTPRTYNEWTTGTGNANVYSGSTPGGTTNLVASGNVGANANANE
jgi:hypothetical protein